MNKKALNESARAHAIKILGEAEFKKNKYAAKAIMEDFKAGWLAYLQFLTKKSSAK